MYLQFGYANPFFRAGGESMLPTINSDSTIVEKNELAGATFDSLRVGDIISFLSPEDNDLIEHRIVYIKNDQNGNKIVMTKGDGNAAPIMGMDYPVREDNYIGKLAFIFNDPFELYRLEDIPIYLLIAPALAFILYLKTRKAE
jgi:signal peptidase